MNLSEEVDLEDYVARPDRISGADINAICQEVSKVICCYMLSKVNIFCGWRKPQGPVTYLLYGYMFLKYMSVCKTGKCGPVKFETTQLLWLWLLALLPCGRRNF
jgi:hypothetical protein